MAPLPLDYQKRQLVIAVPDPNSVPTSEGLEYISILLAVIVAMALLSALVYLVRNREEERYQNVVRAWNRILRSSR